MRGKSGLAGRSLTISIDNLSPGLTTCSEMAFDPALRPLVEQLRGKLSVRLRTYEISNPQMTTAATPGEGDDWAKGASRKAPAMASSDVSGWSLSIRRCRFVLPSYPTP